MFDRSHYEDVLVVRVHDLVPKGEWSGRYAQITAFEDEISAAGTKVVKVMLNISRDEQQRPSGGAVEPARQALEVQPWGHHRARVLGAYQEAYEAALTLTSTDTAPWYVVPADHKWYARWAVQQLLLDAFADLDPQYPDMGWDIDVELTRLAAS